MSYNTGDMALLHQFCHLKAISMHKHGDDLSVLKTLLLLNLDYECKDIVTKIHNVEYIYVHYIQLLVK